MSSSLFFLFIFASFLLFIIFSFRLLSAEGFSLLLFIFWFSSFCSHFFLLLLSFFVVDSSFLLKPLLRIKSSKTPPSLISISSSNFSESFFIILFPKFLNPGTWFSLISGTSSFLFVLLWEVSLFIWELPFISEVSPAFFTLLSLIPI